jgi:sugar lactone lactonase YvrE
MRTSWVVAAACCALLPLLLSGCSGVPATSTSESSSVQGATLQGRVHGGQQPIVGASVYLYAANTTGYGNASVSLLTSAANTSKDGSGNYYVTSDSNGDFTITGDYTCPSTASQVYAYAVGGNPGAGNNPAAGLLAAVGTCPASGILSNSMFIFMDEVSTVATAYAIAGYATDATDVSSSGSTLAQTGIANAFATATNLETLGTGLSLGTTPTANGGNGTVPQSEINTLANILGACINSNPSTSTTCATLFSNAMNGTTAPTDTATAAINIAHNPGANIAALYGLQAAGGAQFQPTLSTAPNDFTIAISYTAGGLYQPEGIAIDSSGDVWVANEASSPGAITELNPTGKALSGSSGFKGGGLDMPRDIAIDASGYVWATTDLNSISKFNSNGSAVLTSPFTGGGLNEDEQIAIDGSGYAWNTNHGNSSLSKFSSGGTAMTGSSGCTGGGMTDPQGIAIDTAGNVWVTNNYPNGLSEFNSGGSAVLNSPFTGGGLNMPSGIAIDGSGNLWVSNNISAGSLSKFNSSGTAVSGSPFTGGGLDYPGNLAIDGAGNVWAANNGSVISEFNSSGTAISGSSGFLGPIIGTLGIAIDGSGNVWVVSNLSNTIVEFVGSAAPVVTPMVANLMSPYGSHAVNKP